MAPTQGFTLSSLPRAPRVPENIGVLDMKAIDEGVRRGLETFEMVRRAPRSMILADATADAETARARSNQAMLPLAERAKQAEVAAMERDLPNRSAVLAAEASPEMIEAKRQALVARTAPKPLTGVPYLLERTAQLERAVQENPNDPLLASALTDARAQLTQARDLAMDKNATAITLGAGRDATQLTTNQNTNQSREAIAAADRTSREAIAAAENKSRESIASSQAFHKQQLANAKTDREREAAGAKARTALMIGEERNKLFNQTVGRAIENLSGTVDGVVTDSKIPGGNIASAVARIFGSFVPGSSSADLEALIETLKSEAGFKELEAMRAASPGNTGASGLGQVTEKELAFLQNRLANLKFSQSDKQLYDNIKVFQDAVNTAWKNANAAYQFDYGPRAVPGAAPMAPAAGQPAAQISPEEKAAAAQWLAENPNDPRAPAVRAKAGL